MKRMVFTVSLDVTDNATTKEVRDSLADCIRFGLHVWTRADAPRESRFGGNSYDFGYREVAVHSVSEE